MASVAASGPSCSSSPLPPNTASRFLIWGESASYDAVIETHGHFVRVQVKSTSYRRPEGCYKCNVRPARGRYLQGKLGPATQPPPPHNLNPDRRTRPSRIQAQLSRRHKRCTIPSKAEHVPWSWSVGTLSIDLALSSWSAPSPTQPTKRGSIRVTSEWHREPEA